MSLINEALKKAQTERPTTAPVQPETGAPGLPNQNQRPPKKRRYLWGFLLSVIVVALFTTTISTFLIFQILGEEENKEKTNAERRLEVTEQNVAELVTVVETATPDNSLQMPLPDEVATPVAQTPPATARELQPEPTIDVIAPATSEPPVATTPPVNLVQDSTTAATAKAQQDSKPVQSTVQTPPPVDPAKPNPAIWARLETLEVRGIMSGGTKVLIFDTSAGKTKTFRPGDMVDGTLGLKIASITSSAIIFEDYGGFKYNKSF